MSEYTKPVPKDISVVFVLGGPGVGKGTQCQKLVKDFGFVHLSAGDLLRAEQDREGSKVGELIKNCIKEGTIVPQEITIALLKVAIMDSYNHKDASKRAKKFLIDGFPRKMDQAVIFEEEVIPAKFVLFFECSEEVMMERLLERSKTSGRDDDNVESIQKRFKVFVETSMPVVKYLEACEKVVRIDCTKSVDDVYADVKTAVKKYIS